MTILSLYLIVLGTIIIVFKNNYIYYLLGLELILFGLNVNFLIIASILQGTELFALTIYFLILAGVETATGLSLIVALNRVLLAGSIYIPASSNLKG
jgi:NADH:ubiquinone oxidoreductase subunit K